MTRSAPARRPGLALGRAVHASTLKCLDLSENDLGSLGSAMVFSGALQCGVQTLVLKGCGVRDGAAQDLSRLVVESTRLTVVNVSRNMLGPSGGKKLASAVAHAQPTLTTVDVGFNPLGVDATLALVAALATSRGGTRRGDSMGLQREWVSDL